MREKFLFPLVLLFLVVFTLGCEDRSASLYKEETASKQSKNREVEETAILEPPKDISSPADAIIHQYEVKFNNGEKEFPNKNSIISETILDNKSILTIKSPEGEHNYSVFLYENKNQWTLEGMIRLDSSENYSDKLGLNLPMKKFNSSSLNFEKNREVWAFVDKNSIITIARFDRYPITSDLKVKEINLKNGNLAFISKDNYQNSFLYYFDSNKTIIISGNVGEKGLINLANSLPSSISNNFPSSKS